MNQLHFVNADGTMTPLGYISTDGIQLQTETETTETLGDWGEVLRTDLTSVQRAVEFTIQIANHHRLMKLGFGTYRLPGDRPLIHKGRKP